MKNKSSVLVGNIIGVVVALAAVFSVLTLSSCANSKVVKLDQDIDSWQNIYSYGKVTAINNELHLISTGNWFLLSKEPYSDFELEAEIMMPETSEYSNSGILFRSQIGENEKVGQFAYGYQAEVDPSDRRWSGGLYEQSTPRQWLHPIHPERSFPDEDFKENILGEWTDTEANAYKHLEWNHYRIKAVGSTIKIWVNSVLTTHVIDTKFSSGYIGIQHHGSHGYAQNGDTQNTIRFRNIEIKPL